MGSPTDPERRRRTAREGQSREARPYHHGDLRRALVDAALALLREHGLEALTLRAVARAAGVSQTAPYRHFADRAALLAGVAEDGFRRLYTRMLRAVGAPISPGHTERSGLQRLALEYLRFALEHPAEYRLMFGDELAGHAPAALPPAFGEARESVFALLRGGIVRLQELGLVRAGDPAAMALSAWALVHGLAMLSLDGQVRRAGAPPPEELALTATDLMMHGMAAGR
ncbi:MAG TPA: TetR/AcrR family transcriptional regulator [Gemmatimonadaceae bacterium]|nr:TetR/AcrR family transcriptional regulator [Gemmatimonadaceae bacterium]